MIVGNLWAAKTIQSWFMKPFGGAKQYSYDFLKPFVAAKTIQSWSMKSFGGAKQYSYDFLKPFAVGEQYSYDFLKRFGVGKQCSYDFWSLLEKQNNTVMNFETFWSRKTIQSWFMKPFGGAKQYSYDFLKPFAVGK